MSVFQNKVIPNFTNELVSFQMTTILLVNTTFGRFQESFDHIKDSNIIKRKGRTSVFSRMFGIT